MFFGIIAFEANAQEDNIFKLDETYSVNSSATIYLHSDDADVKITGTDRKDVHVKISRSVERKGIQFGERNFHVDVKERNGDLYIEDFEESSTVMIMGYVREEYNITIEAPQGVNLKIKGDDDDYRIKGINGSITMNVDDGDAEILNCKGDHFEFDFDDGDIKMDVASGYLKLDIDDGDFEVDNASFSEIDADADDGDIYISTSLADGGTYSFRVDDGTIVMRVISGGGEFNIYHDDASVSTSSEFNTIEKEDNLTVLKLNNGSAKVKVRADDARIKLVQL